MNSIRALLNRIVDYAGLFPPAQLDMASAVRNYAGYLESDESWMLGRLVIPVGRLHEFEREAAELLPSSSRQPAWQISAIASSEAGAVANEIKRIDAFNRSHEEESAGLAVIEAVEFKADSTGMIEYALQHVADDLTAFFEVPVEGDPHALIAALADAAVGAKVRTGGVGPDAGPTPANLARFIARCAAANVPFKATAGLHHPLRHSGDSGNSQRYGFLNVFLAACFAQTHELGEPELVELLQDESIDAFEFDDRGISWRDYRIAAENIEDVRAEFAISFGSCSFEDPVADLRALKLL